MLKYQKKIMKIASKILFSLYIAIASALMFSCAVNPARGTRPMYKIDKY